MAIQSFPEIRPFIVDMTLDELEELKDFITASLNEKLTEQIDELEDRISVLRGQIRELIKRKEQSEG